LASGGDDDRREKDVGERNFEKENPTQRIS
jgi:hypothetical protein